jgi:bifunctional DNA-binding transcriptional regulator/antitoxin component of YhaV-PrlF toxin-antitoxin module
MVQIQQLKNKQHLITLPKNVMELKGWKKGDHLKFELDKGGDVILKVKE